MGLVPLSLTTLQAHVHNVGGLKGRKMMELGDQQMYCHEGIQEASPAKAFFQSHEVEHTSIDLNGLLGAIALDLSKPIDVLDWQGAFDIVTDFGTSEHVGKPLEALYECRKNCHNFCRPGGLMIFMNPKTGNWPGHGYHYFTEEHYWRLAGMCGYRVLEISTHPTLGNTTDGWQIHAVLLKAFADTSFIPFTAFAQACADTVFSH